MPDTSQTPQSAGRALTPGTSHQRTPIAYPHGFTRIDNRIVTRYGPRIGALGLALYVVLSTHANSATRTCFPSMETLSRYLQASRPTIRKALRGLEEAGLVQVARARTGQNTRRMNVYTLLPIPDGQPACPLEDNHDACNGPNGKAAFPSEGNHVTHNGPNGQQAFSPEGNHVAKDRKGAFPEQELINKTQENQRESVREQPVPAPDPHPNDAAIKVYRDACRLAPDATQRAAIVATVTDLAHWAAVVRQWLLAGYRKQNVAGMLDWYRDGIPERSGNHGRNAAGGRAGGGLGFQGHRAGEWRESRPPETPEETARLDAEWDSYVREARSRSQSHDA